MFIFLKGVWASVWTRINYKSNKKDHRHVQATSRSQHYVHVSQEKAYQFPGLFSERVNPPPPNPSCSFVNDDKNAETDRDFRLVCFFLNYFGQEFSLWYCRCIKSKLVKPFAMCVSTIILVDCHHMGIQAE